MGRYRKDRRWPFPGDVQQYDERKWMQTGTQEITVTCKEKCIQCEGDQTLEEMPREVIGSSSLETGQDKALFYMIYLYLLWAGGWTLVVLFLWLRKTYYIWGWFCHKNRAVCLSYKKLNYFYIFSENGRLQMYSYGSHFLVFSLLLCTHAALIDIGQIIQEQMIA